MAQRRAAEGEGWTVRQAVRTPHFWLLFAVYMFTGLGSFLVALHQLAFAVAACDLYDGIAWIFYRRVCDCITSNVLFAVPD